MWPYGQWRRVCCGLLDLRQVELPLGSVVRAIIVLASRMLWAFERAVMCAGGRWAPAQVAAVLAAARAFLLLFEVKEAGSPKLPR